MTQTKSKALAAGVSVLPAYAAADFANSLIPWRGILCRVEAFNAAEAAVCQVTQAQVDRIETAFAALAVAGIAFLSTYLAPANRAKAPPVDNS